MQDLSDIASKISIGAFVGGCVIGAGALILAPFTGGTSLVAGLALSALLFEVAEVTAVASIALDAAALLVQPSKKNLVIVGADLATWGVGKFILAPLIKKGGAILAKKFNWHPTVKGMEKRPVGKIDRGGQNKHISGTNENKTANASLLKKGDNPKTEWKDPTKADELTNEAYKRGTIDKKSGYHSNGTPKRIQAKTNTPVSDDGRTTIDIRINKNGDYHGFPSNKK